jgi:hypothetical protein
MRDGTILGLLVDETSIFRETGQLRLAETVVRIDQSSQVDTLARLNGTEWLITRSAFGAVSMLPFPFRHTSAVEPAPSGFLTAETDSYEFRLFTFSGELKKIVRRIETSQVLTERAWQDGVDQFVNEINNGELRRSILAELRSAERPETIPSFGYARRHRRNVERPVLHDAEGNLWIRGYGHENAEATWSVFDTLGVLMSEVITPANTVPLDIGADYMLLLTRNDVGVEYVQMYELHKQAHGIGTAF